MNSQVKFDSSPGSGDLRAARAAYLGEKDDDTMSDAEWEQVSQLSSKV